MAPKIVQAELTEGNMKIEAVAVKAEFVNDEQAELGMEADAIMDGLIGHGGGEVFQEFAAGDVVDRLFEHARSQADALDEPAFAESGLAEEDDILLAANEIGLGEGFDLQAWTGWIEVPVERAQGQRFAEVGIFDEAFDAALPAQASLIGEQAV